MSVSDGFWFGIGRDIVMPFVVLLAIIAACITVELLKGARRWLWRVRGVPCAATHSRYPTCALTRGHVGAHAGPIEQNEGGQYRHRWSVLTHGEVSWYDYLPTPTPSPEPEVAG